MRMFLFIIISVIYWGISIKYLVKYFKNNVLINSKEISVLGKITHKEVIKNDKNLLEYYTTINYNNVDYIINDFKIFMHSKMGDPYNLNLILKEDNKGNIINVQLAAIQCIS